MELRHLRYLLAVVDHGGFGRAARALRISQPPLSRQVRELEEEVGAQLLNRDRNGVYPTEAGEVFVAGARTVLADLSRCSERARRIEQGEEGSLRIGYSQSAADLMIDAVARYRDSYPKVELELMERTAAQQREALMHDEIDLSLGYRLPPLETEELQARRLFSDPVRIAVPATIRGRGRFALSRLDALPLLFLPRAAAPEIHAQALAALHHLGVRPRAVRDVASVRTVLTMIGGGAGFGLVPRSIADQGARGVSFLARPLPGVRLSTFAFTRHERPAVTRMLEILGEMGPRRRA